MSAVDISSLASLCTTALPTDGHNHGRGAESAPEQLLNDPAGIDELADDLCGGVGSTHGRGLFRDTALTVSVLPQRSRFRERPGNEAAGCNHGFVLPELPFSEIEAAGFNQLDLLDEAEAPGCNQTRLLRSAGR